MAAKKGTEKRSAARAFGPSKAPVVLGNARAYAAWVERVADKIWKAKSSADAERLRIAIHEGLTVRGPHGGGRLSALAHAVHCFALIGITLDADRLDVEPEGALLSLACALESLERTVAAVTAEIETAEAEEWARAGRQGGGR